MFIHIKHLPNTFKRQTLPKYLVSREQLKEKLQVPRERRYIVPGLVLNKTGFFAVPKGDVILIFYNVTKCLLDTDLWCPSF